MDYLKELIKENINDEIFKIFPDIQIIDEQQFYLYNYQTVIFNIFNYQLNKHQYTICHSDDGVLLYNKYVITRNIYIYPLINGMYLHFMSQRDLYISLIQNHNQWHNNYDSGYACCINSIYINEFLYKIYKILNLNINYSHFNIGIKQIIESVKANELLLAL